MRNRACGDRARSSQTPCRVALGPVYTPYHPPPPPQHHKVGIFDTLVVRIDMYFKGLIVCPVQFKRTPLNLKNKITHIWSTLVTNIDIDGIKKSKPHVLT